MERNFFRRVEVAFPILEAGWRQCILADLDSYLRDNVQAWRLGADGAYTRVPTDAAAPVSAQLELAERYAAAGAVSLAL